MKVLQLIDSLEAGGAERVAVNTANILLGLIEKSYLCVTRLEGPLKKEIDAQVEYLFVNKQTTFDTKAFKQLLIFIKKEKITHIHAHGTSFFWATLLKIRHPSLKLIWHEHHGRRVEMKAKDHKMLVFCSYFFDQILTVNNTLKDWCVKNLKAKNVTYLPNFVPDSLFQFNNNTQKELAIVCLANLKPPKDHLNLLQAFKTIQASYPEWKLWLIGKDENDAYSAKLKSYVQKVDLDSSVLFLGVQQNVHQWLQRASIGVLSSNMEGLPMALLEYGAASLPVVVTEAGYCKQVVGLYGKVVPIGDTIALKESLIDYIEQKELRVAHGKLFQDQIVNKYSNHSIVKQLLEIYNA
ncbi:MAG: glycosyltransferase [Flavobacteriaceae bacterium]|nr:glycosyltransferase [Flavobacteriaceae bacterium]|tara:strand:- start:275 stop:1330 length:1056 start_codon:yes stop_codon:yes gene_type:complete